MSVGFLSERSEQLSEDPFIITRFFFVQNDRFSLFKICIVLAENICVSTLVACRYFNYCNY